MQKKEVEKSGCLDYFIVLLIIIFALLADSIFNF